MSLIYAFDIVSVSHSSDQPNMPATSTAPPSRPISVDSFDTCPDSLDYQCLVEVTGVTDGVTKESLSQFLENSKITGGTTVENMVLDIENRRAVVTFQNVLG